MYIENLVYTPINFDILCAIRRINSKVIYNVSYINGT